MKFGITGLAKTGKTTIFNLLTGAGLDTGKFAATVEEIHRGVARLPDPRLDALAKVFKSQKTNPVTIEFLDFGGLSLGSERESKLVGELRNLDAIVHVLRAFEDPELPHPAGSIDPKRDALNFVSELVLNDLILVENRQAKIESMLGKMKTDELIREKALMERVKEILESDRSLREIEFSDDEEFTMRGFGLLSLKPLLFALNLDEAESSTLDSAIDRWQLRELAQSHAVAVCPLCAGIEEEICRLEEEERQLFLDDLGISDLGSVRLLQAAFRLLGLITFFTGNEKEAHAWALPAGSTAIQAAAAVHSDLARGFIRAEVIPCEELVKAGSLADAKHLGKVHVVGKEYIVQDCDLILVRFNV